MNDNRLYEDIIQKLRKARQWIPSDVFRDEFLPLIEQLKNKTMEIKFTKIKDDFSDTVPQSLEERVTQFGIFRDLDN